MSVLNQMLRDLEARAAPLPAAAGGPPRAAAAGVPVAAAVDGADHAQQGNRRTLRRLVWFGITVPAIGIAGASIWLDRFPVYRPVPRGIAQYGAVLAPAAPGAAAATPPLAITAPAAPAAARPAPNDAATSAATVAPRADPAPVRTNGAPLAPARRPRATAATNATAAIDTSPPTVATDPPAAAPVRRSEASLAESNPDIARAATLIARGRHAEAMDLLRTLLARQPLQAEAREALAALLAEAGRRHEALLLLLEGASLDAPRFALRAAQLQHELGDAAGALATLERVPHLRRSGAQHALAGGIALRLGDAGAAIAAYRQALAAPDAQPVWWIGLALAQEAGGQFGAARDSLSRVVRHPALSDELQRFVAQRLAALPAANTGTPVAGLLR